MPVPAPAQVTSASHLPLLFGSGRVVAASGGPQPPACLAVRHLGRCALWAASPCPPPPSLHIPSGLYHPLWSSVTLATLGDFRSELTRLLPGSHPAEPGWGEDWRGRQWPLGVQAKLTRGGWAGKARLGWGKPAPRIQVRARGPTCPRHWGENKGFSHPAHKVTVASLMGVGRV